VDLKTRNAPSVEPRPAPAAPSSRTRLIAVLLLVVVWVAYAFPVFAGKVRFPVGFDPAANAQGEPVHPDMYDVYHNILPWRVHQGERWRAGELASWDPHRFAGMPLGADIGAASWYPPTWVYATGNFLWAFTIFGLLSLLAALLLAHWFLRLLRLHPYAAALGAIGFVFSAFMIKFSEHEGVFQAGMWLPLALGGVELIHRGQRRRGVVLGTLGLGACILAGHAQISLYVWLATAAWAGAALLWGAAGRPEPRPQARSLAAEAGLLAVPFLLSLAFAAVQILPSAEIAPYLARQRYTFESVRSTAISAGQLPTVLIPDFRGNPLDRNFAGDVNYLEQALYPGVVLLPLAAMGLFSRRRREAILFAGMTVVGLLASMGTPLYRLILMLPGFGRTLWMDRFIFFVDAGIAFLAALGLDDLLTRRTGRRRRAAAAAAVALALATALLAWSGNAAVPGSYVAQRGAREVAFLLAAGALLAVLSPKRGTLAIPIVLLAAADLWLFGFRLHLWHEPRPVMAPTALVRHLESLPGPRPRYAEVGKRHETILPPNAALRHGLYGLQGYDVVVPGSIARLLAVAQPDQVNWSAINWLGPFDPQTFGSPVMDLLGVDVVVQPRGMAPVPSTTTEGAFYDDTSAVLRRPGAFPPVFLTSCWTVLPAERVLPELRTMTSEQLRTTALVGDDGGAPAPGPSLDCSAAGTAEVERYEPERVVATTSSSRSSVLVLTDTFMPGWKAKVDGAPAPVLEVDHALRGVAVPAGHHRVEFTYRPSTLVAGAALSVTTVLGLIVASLAGLRRRRPAPGDPATAATAGDGR
jgi:hypothetical protein